MRRRDTRFSEDGPFVDPGEEETVNLAQKIAVSREMTNLLERRLKEMQEIGMPPYCNII